MSEIKRVSIIGAGAMGAYYASKFFRMDPENVSIIAGGVRLTRLKARGLTVNGIHYPVQVSDTEQAGEHADLIIVAVKGYDLPAAIRDMKNHVGPDTLMLSVMNGIDSETQLGEAFAPDKVLYCIALGIDAVRAPDGSVTNTKEGKLLFGEAKNPVRSEKVKRVGNAFDRARIAYEVPVDMVRSLWWKFMINVGVNQVSAVLRAPYGVFQRVLEARRLMETVMKEVIRLAGAEGVALKEEDIGEWVRIMSGLSPEGKTSMLQDVEAGRKTEVEMFGGKVLELAAKHKLQVPVNETIYRIIKVMERRAGF
jgi:2-dehydropantoate 2-reductase